MIANALPNVQASSSAMVDAMKNAHRLDVAGIAITAQRHAVKLVWKARSVMEPVMRNVYLSNAVWMAVIATAPMAASLLKLVMEFVTKPVVMTHAVTTAPIVSAARTDVTSLR